MIKSVVGILLLILFTLIILPFHIISLVLYPKLADQIAHIWHYVSRWVLGLKVTISGEPATGSVLYLSNHVSWLDIVAISRAAPLAFIAKADVAGWPLISFLAKWQRTIFVDRNRKARTGITMSEMVSRLEAGDNLVLFPEGTSGDGWAVLPFKSALIGAVVEAARRMQNDGADLKVQPLSIAYTRLGGLPLGRMEDNKVAWMGDLDLLPHLWAVMKDAKLEAVLNFGNPVPVTADSNRKALADEMHFEVERLLGEIRQQVPRAQ